MGRKPVRQSLPSLDHLDIEGLTAIIEQATARREALKQQMRQSLRAELEAHAARYGLSLEDVVALPSPAAREKRRKPDVKYRGPKGESWTGRGRTPRWLAALEAKGQARSRFEV